jgi:hypothetical protein
MPLAEAAGFEEVGQVLKNQVKTVGAYKVRFDLLEMGKNVT